jgi:hypothetical protein
MMPIEIYADENVDQEMMVRQTHAAQQRALQTSEWSVLDKYKIARGLIETAGYHDRDPTQNFRLTTSYHAWPRAFQIRVAQVFNIEKFTNATAHIRVALLCEETWKLLVELETQGRLGNLSSSAKSKGGGKKYSYANSKKNTSKVKGFLTKDDLTNFESGLSFLQDATVLNSLEEYNNLESGLRLILRRVINGDFDKKEALKIVKRLKEVHVVKIALCRLLDYEFADWKSLEQKYPMFNTSELIKHVGTASGSKKSLIKKFTVARFKKTLDYDDELTVEQKKIFTDLLPEQTLNKFSELWMQEAQDHMNRPDYEESDRMRSQQWTEVNFEDDKVGADAGKYVVLQQDLAKKIMADMSPRFMKLRITSFVLSVAYGLKMYPGDTNPTSMEDLLIVLKNFHAMTTSERYTIMVFCRHDQVELVNATLKESNA